MAIIFEHNQYVLSTYTVPGSAYIQIEWCYNGTPRKYQRLLTVCPPDDVWSANYHWLRHINNHDKNFEMSVPIQYLASFLSQANVEDAEETARQCSVLIRLLNLPRHAIASMLSSIRVRQNC